jgi:hypothetical protein
MMRSPLIYFSAMGLLFTLGGVACMTPSTRDARLIQQQVQPGDYLVIGRDARGAGDALDKLAPVHWDYIDRFASRLVARGPILSDNGE